MVVPTVVETAVAALLLLPLTAAVLPPSTEDRCTCDPRRLGPSRSPTEPAGAAGRRAGRAGGGAVRRAGVPAVGTAGAALRPLRRARPTRTTCASWRCRRHAATSRIAPGGAGQEHQPHPGRGEPGRSADQGRLHDVPGRRAGPARAWWPRRRPGAVPRSRRCMTSPAASSLARLGKCARHEPPRRVARVRKDAARKRRRKRRRCVPPRADLLRRQRRRAACRSRPPTSRRWPTSWSGASRFPGVQFMQTTQRQYPFGRPRAQRARLRRPDHSTSLKDRQVRTACGRGVVGQAGVEYSYDPQLRGRTGSEQSYDATGRAVGQAYLHGAQPGATLQLTIDYRLQQVAQKAIAYGIQVARNDGEIGRAHGRWWRWIPTPARSTPWPPTRATTRPRSCRRQRATTGSTRQVQPAAGRQDAAAGGARVDLQADHRHRGLERGHAGAGRTLECPGVFTARATPRTRRSHNWDDRQRARSRLPTALEIVQHLLLPARQQVLRPAQPGHRLPEADPPVRLRHAAADRPAGCHPSGGPGTGSGLAAAELLDADRPDLAAGLRHPDGDRPGRPDRLADAAGGRPTAPSQTAASWSTPHVGKALLDSDGSVHHTAVPGPAQPAPVAGAAGRRSKRRPTRPPRRPTAPPTRCSAASRRPWPARPVPPSIRLHQRPTPGMPRGAPVRPSQAGVVALIDNGGHGGTSAAPAALKVYQAFFHPNQKTKKVVGHGQVSN